MQHRCLYCYQPLPANGTDFHPKCSKAFFGTSTAPALDYRLDEMEALASQEVAQRITVTGIQPKLSLTVIKEPNNPKHGRFTIVGLWGEYILKPPTAIFAHLPENEDVTMHLAALFGIPTAAHSLVRLKSGELAYITKRFDRENGDKLAVEDLCQLTETLTEDKYRSSMEKAGKHIAKFSDRPGLDVAIFFETALFCYLTGNRDMHLKNFSLLTRDKTVLAPAYDLLCTKIVMPEDKDDMALTINARRRRLKKNDFDCLAKNLHIPEKSMENVYTKFKRKIKEVNALLDISFLPTGLKEAYKEVLTENAGKIELG